MKKKPVKKRIKISVDVEQVKSLYFDKEMSIYEIAEQLESNPSKIRRVLISSGCELRTRNDAQKNRLASGKAEHPTKGKIIPESVRIKIGDAAYDKWQNMSDEERARRANDASKRLLARDDREEMQKKGFEAIAKAAKEGSALEKYLADKLLDAGFQVLIHQKHMVQSNNMHLDILLPIEKIAIEVDGPSHYESVWSEEDLARVKKTDQKKNGLLVLNGYNVIRVKQPRGPSKKFVRETGIALVDLVNEIIKKGLKKKQVYFM
jgi:very-short-patch-repair endonuclease